MVFVFVLNLGYDVPVKQISLALALLSLIVLIPWMGRLTRAVLGRGQIPRGRVPVQIGRASCRERGEVSGSGGASKDGQKKGKHMVRHGKPQQQNVAAWHGYM